MERIEPHFNRASTCIAGGTPPCARACPLGVDVLGMIGKCKNGLFSSAWKIFSKDATLPGIVCHICDGVCESRCVGTDADKTVSIRSLEQFCYLQSKKAPEAKFYIPDKKKQILVIGAGPAGLSCAVKLAERGYRVELFEKEEEIGGSLWNYEENILPERELRAELERIRGKKYLHIHVNSEISDIDSKQFDAVVYAWGNKGAQWSEQKVQGQEGKFYVGACFDESLTVLEAIRQASLLSYEIESYVKVGRIVEIEGALPCDFVPDYGSSKMADRLPDYHVETWTRETAVQEASRCLQCSCSRCYDNCHMMQWYDKDPQRLIHDIHHTVNKFTLTRKEALWQIAGCYQCGRCRVECGKDIDLGELCLEAKRYLHEAGKYPDAIYDYWMSDMEHANTEGAVSIHTESKSSQFLFFPGCQLSASLPEHVARVYSMLCEKYSKRVSLMVGCCGAPALWAGREREFHQSLNRIKEMWNVEGKPVILAACPTCQRLLEEHFPDATIESLWGKLEVDSCLQLPQEQKVAIFDPCGSRKKDDVQEAVRTLMRQMGYEIEELSHGGKPLCCGFGGLVSSSQQKLAEHITKSSAQLSELPYVTYCSNCNDNFNREGKMSKHILEVLFNDLSRPQSFGNLSTRRRNRLMLKNTLEGRDGGVCQRQPWEDIQISIPRELRDRMNRELIIDENVQRVIYHAKLHNTYVMDEETGECTAGLQEKNTTFWVTYVQCQETDTYDIKNVYFHRMKIGPKETI